MNITIVPDKILTRSIPNTDPKDIKNGVFSELVEEMRKTMVDAKGVGLSANQVGRDIRLFVIDKKIAEDYEVPDVYFNAEITNYAREEDEVEEGCLSIPGHYIPVRRAKKIMLKALDENGGKLKIRARGFLARVLQHETDHLNGTTIQQHGVK